MEEIAKAKCEVFVKANFEAALAMASVYYLIFEEFI